MKYIYTKLVWRNNKYVLQVKQHKTDPFKQVFSSKIKQEVKARREQLRHESIPYMDIRLDELTRYKLMVITKQLNQKSLDKTVRYLIDKAHTDGIKRSV